MQISAPAIIVASREHGEHGAVVRALTEGHGLLVGYVRGARSRALKPVLVPGNDVVAEWRSRSETQLAAMTAELSHSRAPLLSEPLPALAIAWITGLVATALPEGQPYPQIYAAVDGLLCAVEAAPSARGWVGAMASAEEVMLAALGYGNAPVGTLEDRLRVNGIAIAQEVLTGRRTDVLAARERLMSKLGGANVL